MMTETKKIYGTWDEAWRALHPQVRQQSVRVAAYTEVLFAQACSSSFATHYEGIVKKNAELAYKCALYHQIGKSLVAHEYQIEKKSFTPEEAEIYRRYTSDGRILIAKLQEKTEKRWLHTPDFSERPTENVAWQMIRDTAEQHMEHWDGTGYPDGRQGNEISAMAQIVGLAKELDHLASDFKSEAPFEEAMNAIVAETNKKFSEELIKVLKACRGKCRAVFQKYILYTKAVPKTVPLVNKRKDRPMGLLYRPMTRGRVESVIAYEAVPWFKGSLENPNGTESLKEMEAVLHRTDLTDDMTFYFLYEAADTVLRLQNCKLPSEGVMLPIVKDFYTTGNKMPRLLQLYEDQPIDKRQLCLTVPQSALLEMNDETKNFIKQIVEEGIPLAVDDYEPNQLSMEILLELGIYKVRFSRHLYLSNETARIMKMMKNNGFQIIGGGADNYDLVAWLDIAGTTFMSGEMTGDLMDEETLIRDLLEKERNDG